MGAVVEAADLDVEPGPGAPRGGGTGAYVYVSDDPDRDWARIAPHAIHDTNEYARWIGGRRGVFAEVSDPDELRKTGTYQVVTPDECVEIARATGSLTFKPVMGGMDPDIGWEGLQLFADKVLPRL